MNESAEHNSADHETVENFVQSEEAKITGLFYNLKWNYFGPGIASYFWGEVVHLFREMDSLPEPITNWVLDQEALLREDPPDWLVELIQEGVNERVQEASVAVDSAADCFISNSLSDAISNGLQTAAEEIASSVYDTVSEELADAARGLVYSIESDDF